MARNFIHAGSLSPSRVYTQVGFSKSACMWKRTFGPWWLVLGSCAYGFGPLKPLQQQVLHATTYLTKLSFVLGIYQVLGSLFSRTSFENTTVLLYFNHKWNTKFWPPLLSLRNSYQISSSLSNSTHILCWISFVSCNNTSRVTSLLLATYASLRFSPLSSVFYHFSGSFLWNQLSTPCSRLLQSSHPPLLSPVYQCYSNKRSFPRFQKLASQLPYKNTLILSVQPSIGFFRFTITAWLHKQPPSILHIRVNLHFPQENKHHYIFFMLL